MLSIIIPTRNRCDFLQLALESLSMQTLSSSAFEVLIIDNGSTDLTKRVVESYQGKIKNLEYFFESTPGLHVGRHRGLKEASGDILVYADDDIEAYPSWLEAIQNVFQSDDSVALVGGNNIPNYENAPPKWLKILWSKPFINGHAVPALSVIELPDGQYDFPPAYVWGCNFSIRKKVLLDAGGFHPDGVPQELIHLRGDGESHVSSYIQTNGLRTVFDSKASVKHAVTNGRMTFDYFCRRAFNQGVSDSYQVLRKNRGYSKFLVIKSRVTFEVRHFLKRIRNILRSVKSNHEISVLSSMMLAEHRKGFVSHNQQYLMNPDLQEWVHKENYY